jgi:limonene-1,2-epoxide hydrolase
MNATQQENCQAWIDVFTQLGQQGPPTIEQLARITAETVRFRDPFNELSGRASVLKLLEHTQRQIQDVSFEVTDQAESGQRVYLKWRMRGRLRVLGQWRVTGMSELLFDDAGRLLLHQDYWDAAEQFYAHLPIIGWLMRRLRSLAAVS